VPIRLPVPWLIFYIQFSISNFLCPIFYIQFSISNFLYPIFYIQFSMIPIENFGPGLWSVTSQKFKSYGPVMAGCPYGWSTNLEAGAAICQLGGQAGNVVRYIWTSLIRFPRFHSSKISALQIYSGKWLSPWMPCSGMRSGLAAATFCYTSWIRFKTNKAIFIWAKRKHLKLWRSTPKLISNKIGVYVWASIANYLTNVLEATFR